MTLSPLRRALAVALTAFATVSGPSWALPTLEPVAAGGRPTSLARVAGEGGAIGEADGGVRERPPVAGLRSETQLRRSPPDPDQIRLDQTVQQLRQEVLRINVEAQAAEDALRYPQMSRADFLFGVAVSQLLVSEIRLQIADRPVVTQTFSGTTASALLRSGGLQRVMRANLEPGVYSLKVEVEGQFADAKPGTEPLRLEQTASIEKTLAPLQIQIDLAPERRRDRNPAAGFFGRGGPVLQIRSSEAQQP